MKQRRREGGRQGRSKGGMGKKELKKMRERLIW